MVGKFPGRLKIYDSPRPLFKMHVLKHAKVYKMRWSTMFNAADCVIFSWKNSGRKFDWNRNSRQELFKNLAIPDKVVLFYGNSGKYSSLEILRR